jgi:iron complex transport system ATP-binding protein
VLALVTLIVAAQVAVRGAIGWVGLVVPHLARRLVGANHQYLLPASALLGAVYLLGVDDIARSVAQQELPIAYRPGQYVIRHATFGVRRGHVVAVLGPNGSGKTTLLKLMAGVMQASGGSASVSGQIAYVPQFVQLSFAYSVLDVVVMGRARHVSTFATPSRHDEDVAAKALERVGMLAFAHRLFDELSGGERQLVTFARALAAEASVLLLDEPTASLDLRHPQDALRWISRLAHDEGLTVVFSTHQPQHADVVADDVVLLSGSATDLLQPAELSALFGVALRRQAVAENGGSAGVLIPDFTL